MGDAFLQGQALGASLASTVTQGVAQWRQIQLEKQQQKEFEGGIALYNQRTMASRQAMNPEPQNLLSAYQMQWQRYPQSEVEQRPTGTVAEDGQAEMEAVIRTPEGDIPLAQLNQLKASKMQGEIQLTMADFDALAELQARYPDNPKIKQFVASTAATINQRWQLKFKAQEQAGLQMAQQLAAQQFQQEQALKQQQLAEQQRQFDAGPERQRQDTDEGIRRDAARIQAEKGASLALEGAKAAPQKAPTEYDKKLGQLATRAREALETYDSVEYDRTSVGAGVESMLPSALQSGKRQQVEQAQLQLVNSVLRAESGATITPDEISKKVREFFPQAGDSKEVVEQKRQARTTAVEAMEQSVGSPQAGSKSPERFRSPDEVRAAYQAGKLSREDARMLLKTMGR